VREIIVTQFYVPTLDALALLLSGVGTLCWAVCFWWMHRISSHQDALLEELHEMTRRIEKLSRTEHDLIREVHPKVNEIKEHVEDVREAVEK
jgi:hypothetical protein